MSVELSLHLSFTLRVRPIKACLHHLSLLPPHEPHQSPQTAQLTSQISSELCLSLHLIYCTARPEVQFEDVHLFHWITVSTVSILLHETL